MTIEPSASPGRDHAGPGPGGDDLALDVADAGEASSTPQPDAAGVPVPRPDAVVAPVPQPDAVVAPVPQPDAVVAPVPQPEVPSRAGRLVRDRDVIVLSAAIVVAVLAIQGLTIISPALNDAIGRPPTVIIFLVVVTIVVMVRVALAMVRQR